MPGLDHEVHELVRSKDGDTYGCWGRSKFSDGYYAPNRQYSPHGTGNFTMVKTFIPHLLSTECRYDMSLTDKKCVGCINIGSGEAYNEMVRRLGT